MLQKGLRASSGLIICRTIAAVVGACRTKKQPSTNEIMLQCLYLHTTRHTPMYAYNKHSKPFYSTTA